MRGDKSGRAGRPQRPRARRSRRGVERTRKRAVGPRPAPPAAPSTRGSGGETPLVRGRRGSSRPIAPLLGVAREHQPVLRSQQSGDVCEPRLARQEPRGRPQPEGRQPRAGASAGAPQQRRRGHARRAGFRAVGARRARAAVRTPLTDSPCGNLRAPAGGRAAPTAPRASRRARGESRVRAPAGSGGRAPTWHGVTGERRSRRARGAIASGVEVVEDAEHRRRAGVAPVASRSAFLPRERPSPSSTLPPTLGTPLVAFLPRTSGRAGTAPLQGRSRTTRMATPERSARSRASTRPELGAGIPLAGIVRGHSTRRLCDRWSPRRRAERRATRG